MREYRQCIIEECNSLVETYETQPEVLHERLLEKIYEVLKWEGYEEVVKICKERIV